MTSPSRHESGLLRVACPRVCNTQQQGIDGATTHATGAQQTGLKALALLALGRNNTRNKGAIDRGKHAQQTPVADPSFVAQETPADSVACVAFSRGATAQQGDVRGRLIGLADADLFDVALLDGQDDDDLALLAGLDDKVLRAFLRCLHGANLRELGRCPPDETGRALCRSCGPVWIAPEVAKLAPVIAGWPRVLGCPWCHVQNRQAIPRPRVTCGECQN